MNKRKNYNVARLLLPLLAVVACFTAAPAPARGDEAFKPFDQWFTILMGDQPSGWMHATQQQEKPGGPLVSAQEMQISIKRGATVINIEIGSSFTETPEGQAISAQSRQKFAVFDVTQDMQFGPDGIEVTSTQNGAQRKYKVPTPKGEWLTPLGVERYVEGQVAKGAKEVKFRAIDATLGPNPIETTMTLLGEENVQAFGKVVPAIKWQTTTSLMPGMKTLEYLDAHGQPVKLTTSIMPGLEMTIIASDKELATKKVDPPELLADTLVRPNKPIANPRRTQTAVFELKFVADRPSPKLPSTGFQRVVWGDDKTARVVVDLNTPVAPGTDLPTDENRKPSTTLDSSDEKVRGLVAKALGDDADKLTPTDKAERLRKFVHGFIAAKDLSVGFATASEVARTAEGDCSEHGVLLAAMLRAAGIPSRTASGLIYVDQFAGQKQVFGYHMWSQAWLGAGPNEKGGGRWVDLDATLGDRPFDATHITLSTNAMSDRSAMNDMVSLAGVLGGVAIDVVQVEGK
jgi:Transglutaminase-like superfamily